MAFFRPTDLEQLSANLKNCLFGQCVRLEDIPALGWQQSMNPLLELHALSYPGHFWLNRQVNASP